MDILVEVGGATSSLDTLEFGLGQLLNVAVHRVLDET
jgi:hypothetical protein